MSDDEPTAMLAVVRWVGQQIKLRWPFLLIGGGVVLVALVLWAALVEPPWLLDAKGLSAVDRVKAQSDLRNTLVTLLGGFAVLVGGAVGAANVVATQRVQWRAQVTKRFSKAIEQLGQPGDDKLDVRIGAVYALEQIARDSADLHWPIMEVLTAYLREHAQVPPPAISDDAEPEFPMRRTADYQAIATVLGRRRRSQDPVDQHLDLSRVDLKRVRWPNTHLERAYLREARLEGANLRQAQLDGADLIEAKLKGAYLREARLQGATLFKANMDGAALTFAHLEGANLKEAQLKEANLKGAQLKGAFLEGAQLERADLEDVDLTQVDGLTWPQLQLAKNVDLSRLPGYLRADAGHYEPVAPGPVAGSDERDQAVRGDLAREDPLAGA